MSNSNKLSEFVFNFRKIYQLSHPSKNELHQFLDDLLGFIFPQHSSLNLKSETEIEFELQRLQQGFVQLLSAFDDFKNLSIQEISTSFFQKLPSVCEKLSSDAKAIYQGDPAAYSINEVILTYPGFYAISMYRLAHELYVLNLPVFPRIITEYAHQQTGIDIHPGAEIGNSFCIDHGTGIVIGETSIIGNNVKMYQGVTLGALSVDKEMAKKKRHPTLEDFVVIYSGATILGGDTVIGEKTVIGGNVWLTESVAPNSVVYHKSEIKVRSNKSFDEPINFTI